MRNRHVLAAAALALAVAVAAAAPATGAPRKITLVKDGKTTGRWVVGTGPTMHGGCHYAAFFVFKRPNVKPPKKPKGYRSIRRDPKRLEAKGWYKYFGNDVGFSGHMPFDDAHYATFRNLEPLGRDTHAILGNQGSSTDPAGCADNIATQHAQLGPQRNRATVTQYFVATKAKKAKKRKGGKGKKKGKR